MLLPAAAAAAGVGVGEAEHVGGEAAEADVFQQQGVAAAEIEQCVVAAVDRPAEIAQGREAGDAEAGGKLDGVAGAEALDLVAAGGIDEDVDAAGAAVQLVVAGAAVEPVIARAAVEFVVAGETEQPVVAVAVPRFRPGPNVPLRVSFPEVPMISRMFASCPSARSPASSPVRTGGMRSSGKRPVRRHCV